MKPTKRQRKREQLAQRLDELAQAIGDTRSRGDQEERAVNRRVEKQKREQRRHLVGVVRG